jgi:RNA polymerase sigma factor (sigma-70 family)
MSNNRVGSVVRTLRRLASRDGAGLTDGQLLDCFIVQRDEAAFEALVRRYGRMVLGVCRRVLGCPHDADDAFQATFLVLVRQAASVRRRESVGSWLYGVACRTALHLRRGKARRRFKETEAQTRRHRAPLAGGLSAEVVALLDWELARVPDRYRSPVVLCDLLGKTKRQAAEQLRCPEGTVSSRLARGRALLARRLARHGPLLSAVPLGAYFTAGATAAPAALVSSTVKAATLIAAGPAVAAGLIAPRVAALTEGALNAMAITKLKLAAALILALVCLGAGTGLLTYRALAGEPANPAQAAAHADNEALIRRDEAATPREALRYGGKTFAAWREVLRTDLKPEVRIEAIKALAAFGSNGYAEEATAAIVEVIVRYHPDQLSQDEWKIIDFAQENLARIGPKAILALAKQHRKGRWFAIGALRHLIYGDDADEVVRVLFQALKDKDATIRSDARQALNGAASDTTGLISGYTALLKDEDATLRLYAIISLGKHGQQSAEAVPALLAVLKNSRSADDRLAIVTSLGSIGPAAKAALPVLSEVFTPKDLAENPKLGEAVAEALKKIRP